MREYCNGFLYSDEKDLLQISRIFELLSTTYWAHDRSMEQIQKSINNSKCFGVYKDGVQIGFARCVTDYAVIFWLCDVVIDQAYTHMGLGQKLIELVNQNDDLKELRGILTTKKHQQFYTQFGYKSQSGFMFKSNKPNSNPNIVSDEKNTLEISKKG